MLGMCVPDTEATQQPPAFTLILKAEVADRLLRVLFLLARYVFNHVYAGYG